MLNYMMPSTILESRLEETFESNSQVSSTNKKPGKKDGGESWRLRDFNSIERDRSRVFRDADLVKTREKQGSDDREA